MVISMVSMWLLEMVINCLVRSPPGLAKMVFFFKPGPWTKILVDINCFLNLCINYFSLNKEMECFICTHSSKNSLPFIRSHILMKCFKHTDTT